MDNPIEKKADVIQTLLKGKIDRRTAARILKVSIETISRYKKAFIKKGMLGLKDNRGGNHKKLTLQDKKKIIDLKSKNRWRSARNIRDELELKVNQKTVRRVIIAAGMDKENRQQVKKHYRHLNIPILMIFGKLILWERLTFPILGVCI